MKDRKPWNKKRRVKSDGFLCEFRNTNKFNLIILNNTFVKSIDGNVLSTESIYSWSKEKGLEKNKE